MYLQTYEETQGEKQNYGANPQNIEKTNPARSCESIAL